MMYKKSFLFLNVIFLSTQEKDLDNLSLDEQRILKEQILAEKQRKIAEMKRKVAERKRQEELAIQQRLKKQRDSLGGIMEQSSGFFNKEEQER